MSSSSGGLGGKKMSFLEAATGGKQQAPTTPAPVKPPPQPLPPPPKPQVTPKPVAKPSGSGKPVSSCPSPTPMERGYPLGFDSQEQFDECMSELREAAEDEGIDCQQMGVRGSAATFVSQNPNKKGQYFDKKGQGTSDIDVFFVTDTKLKDRPSKEGFFHPDKIGPNYPKIQAWNEKWSKELGRDITAAAMKSNSPKLNEGFLPSNV